MHYPTAEDFGRVANILLSPDETRRFLANDLLADMFMLLRLDENNPHRLRNIGLASRNHIADCDMFIPALISYWAGLCKTLQMSWMAQCGFKDDSNFAATDTNMEGWYTPFETHYPIQQFCEIDGIKPMMPLLMGIQDWLVQAVEAKDIVLMPQIIACLKHPEYICQDTAIKMLANIGAHDHGIETLQPAIVALLARIAEHGRNSSIFLEGHALVTLIGTDSTTWLAMADQIDVECSLAQVEGYCATFNLIPDPPLALLDRLITIIENISEVQFVKQGILLACVSALAYKANHRRRELRTTLIPLIAAPSGSLRSAVATALGYVGQFPEDDSFLITLSQDQEDWVRNCAHRAARYSTNPTLELIEVTAKSLDNYDLCDGMPHDDVVETLVAWGADSIAVIGDIQRWLTAVAQAPNNYDRLNQQELCLITNLGDHAKPLLPLLQAIHQVYIESDCEDEDTDDDGIEQLDDIDFGMPFAIENDVDFGIDLENESDFDLSTLSQALTALQVRLAASSAELRALADDDEDLDHESLAAIKELETRITPLLTQLLIDIEHGDIAIAKTRCCEVKPLVKEGQELVAALVKTSFAKVFRASQIEIEINDAAMDHREALLQSFIAEMQIGDLEVPDTEPSTNHELTLLALIERLQATTSN